MESHRLSVGASDAGARLDRWLSRQLPELSRTTAGRLVREGAVQVDGRAADKPSLTLHPGQVVLVSWQRRPPAHAPAAEDIPLRVIYEDDVLAVIDKPAGMVIHPAPGAASGTLVHALLHRFGSRLAAASDAARPGIVHRLDKGTTGLMIVALDDRAHRRLAAQFAARTVEKVYVALVYGEVRQPSGCVDAAIGRDRIDRLKISTNTASPRAAVTDWEVVERFRGLTLLHARPRTGRTHQIRAHMSLLGHPLVGDALYAGRRWKNLEDEAARDLVADFPRPALHAARLQFEHPVSGERLRFEAPLPADFLDLLEALRRRQSAGLPADPPC